MEEQLVETWNIHDRIHRYLLDAIPPEALGCASASKGRTVAEQLAHVHNVRLMWLGSAAPELLDRLQKIEKGGAADKEALSAALTASGRAVDPVREAQGGDPGVVIDNSPFARALYLTNQ